MFSDDSDQSSPAIMITTNTSTLIHLKYTSFTTIERVLIGDTVRQPFMTCNDTSYVVFGMIICLCLYTLASSWLFQSEITLQYFSLIIQTSVGFLARSPLTISSFDESWV
jgi:hypothetical protein